MNIVLHSKILIITKEITLKIIRFRTKSLLKDFILNGVGLINNHFT